MAPPVDLLGDLIGDLLRVLMGGVQFLEGADHIIFFRNLRKGDPSGHPISVETIFFFL